MSTKSLYQLKKEEQSKDKTEIITDADYFLRDKKEEAKNGYPNSLDVTPVSNTGKKTVKE